MTNNNLAVNDIPQIPITIDHIKATQGGGMSFYIKSKLIRQFTNNKEKER